MDLWVFFGLSVLAGTVGAVLASAVWIMLLRQLRPNLRISHQIARYRDSKDGKVYCEIKVVNQAPRIAIDVEAELSWVDEMPWNPKEPRNRGYVQYYVPVELKRPKVRLLNKFDKKDEHGLYAFRFRTNEPLKDNWQDAHEKLQFRVIVTDQLSLSMKTFTQEYAKLNDPIQDGVFKPNESMEIISQPVEP